MPPKKNAEQATGNGPSLTQNEYSFIGSMLRHMTARPEVDWDSVASELGLKDAKCTKERYRQMGVKHGWTNNTPKKPANGTAAAAASPTASKVTKTPRSAKKKTPKKAPVEPSPEPEMDEVKLEPPSSSDLKEDEDKDDSDGLI